MTKRIEKLLSIASFILSAISSAGFIFYDEKLEKILTFIGIVFFVLLGIYIELIHPLIKGHIRSEYILNKKEKRILELFKHRKRVVIMLPLSIQKKEDLHFFTEVNNCSIGIGKALKKLRKEVAYVDLVVKDHKNDSFEAAKIIKEELDLGCQHFICTMSSVCNDLASKIKGPNHFNSILSDYNTANNNKSPVKAILICTVATSSSIKPSFHDNIFRFFIEAELEADDIAARVLNWCSSAVPILIKKKIKNHFDEHGNQKYEIDKTSIPGSQLKNACTIFTKNDKHIYSQESGSKFCEEIKKGGKINNQLITITNPDNTEEVLNANSNYIKNADLLFIIASFPTNIEIIEYILEENRLKSECILITPSVFPKLHLEKKHFAEKGEKFRVDILSRKGLYWFISRPEKIHDETKKPMRFYGELSEFGMNISLQMVVKIISSPDYHIDSFRSLWNSKITHDITKKFSVVYDVHNDPKIKTELIQCID